MKLVLTEEARRDLLLIGDYIAQDSPARALTFVDELDRHCRVLAEQPEAYQLVPRYAAQRIRRAVHGRYSIFFRIDAAAVVVLHIIPGAMDLERLFSPE